MVRYHYDAWGNHEVLDENGAEITDKNHIGNLNPFRYRSYFYDPETRLYFLKTRYYDPEIGRFISPDSIDYADPMSLDGLNLYAYCNNNPVMNVDPTGTSLIGFIVWGAINIVKNITTKKPQPQKTENTSFNEFGNDFGSEWDLDLGMGLQNPFEQIGNLLVKVSDFFADLTKEILLSNNLVNNLHTWIRNNPSQAVDAGTSIYGIGGGVVTLLSALSTISVPVAGQIFLGITSIAAGIYSFGRAFNWW